VKIKMIRLTFIIGIALLAMVFQKNPVWGMFAIGVYILIKSRRRRFNSNKGLIDSAQKNTFETIHAMNMGFQSIADAIKGEDTEMYYDEDKKQRGYFKKRAVNMDMYKN